MDQLLFLDTETTGNDFLIDRIFQVCYSHKGSIQTEYFKPPLPISIKSQSITHVTNKMLEGKKSFTTSAMKKDLETLLQKHILVAHNAYFDIEMLFKEGLKTPQFICTLKLARFLDTEGIVPEYNLQYLRYYLELDVKADAHNAQDDVAVLEALFAWQYKTMLLQYKTHDAVIEKMLEVSNQPSLFKVFNFGKHRGKKVEDILGIDRSYMEWLLEKKLENTIVDEDWIFTLKYHLEKR